MCLLEELKCQETKGFLGFRVLEAAEYFRLDRKCFDSKIPDREGFRVSYLFCDFELCLIMNALMFCMMMCE